MKRLAPAGEEDTFPGVGWRCLPPQKWQEAGLCDGRLSATGATNHGHQVLLENTIEELLRKIQPAEKRGRPLAHPASSLPLVLPSVWRPHDHLGAPHRGGDVPAFSTPVSHEALMKCCSPLCNTASARYALAYVCLLTGRQPLPAQPIPSQYALGTSTRPGAYRFWPADPHSPCLSTHPRYL